MASTTLLQYSPLGWFSCHVGIFCFILFSTQDWDFHPGEAVSGLVFSLLFQSEKECALSQKRRIFCIPEDILIFLLLVVRFVALVIDHNLGYRIWPSLAQHSITQVMIYNLGYDL